MLTILAICMIDPIFPKLKRII